MNAHLPNNLHAAVIPAAFVAVLVFCSLFFLKRDFGPDTMALDEKRPLWLRRLVKLLVLPLRLVASVFSGAVLFLVLALVAGFAWIVWQGLQG